MLQKLENLYLAILRFVVILISGILLVAVVIFAPIAFQAIQSAPIPKEVTPQVSGKELIKDITAKPGVATNQTTKVNQGEVLTDPNMVYYERIATAIINFYEKCTHGSSTGNKKNIIEFVKNRAEQQRDPKLVSAFVKNLDESIVVMLQDEAVINTARSTLVDDVLGKALTAFTEEFNSQIEKVNAENAAKQVEYSQKKAAGIQSLYIAAAAFGAFLIIVFLSVIIRIERNLRHLENKPSVVA